MGRVAPPLPRSPGQSFTLAQLEQEVAQGERQLRRTRVLLSAARLCTAGVFFSFAAALLLNQPH